MKKQSIISILLILGFITMQAQEVEVLTLGTFHFAFYNKDIETFDEEEQIDVLDPKYQSEIEDIVEKASRFNPTIIAIEVGPNKQSKIDSLYHEYLNGNHALSRSESEQIGFRLAKNLGLENVYCVNDWGEIPENVDAVLSGNDSLAKQKFYDSFYHNPDSLIMYNKEYVFKTKGILEEFREMNSEEHIKKDLGNYLISVFKYQTEDDPFFGVDFTTGWWFNRNLRIFRNIQRIETKPEDRILVIFGVGHMNLLNILFDASPEYKLVRTNDYLE